MIISQSTVSLQSTHEQTSVSHREESFRAWVDGDPNSARTIAPEEATELSIHRIIDEVRLSAESFSLAHGNLPQNNEGVPMPDEHALMQRLKKCAHGHCKTDKNADAVDDDAIIGDSRLNLMKQMVEMLTGKKVRVVDPSKYTEDTSSSEVADKNSIAPHAPDTDAVRAEAPQREGWGVAYDSQETIVETERTRFAAEGMVQTADGKEISFEAALQMERENISVTSFQLRAGDAKLVDPLVLNFNGSAAQLTNEKIAFDLNQDGIDESISFVTDGSGFLVLDKNKDGIVNDGGELFGPSTGNGFAELADYDDDQNGWIDEADSVYDDLRIWTGGTAGFQLANLQSANVGAIYLGNAATPFENRDATGTLTGQTVSTGIFIAETGQVGTVQQIDLVG
ncbi:MAG: hypothetical protein JXX29_03475 [Deltaproteobacteria bacterium]|nr:hypothetical protein [Deltaproteobacteria bacterium]MBN2670703.1 hypothetical protein [Deltaproteobacteria bacterium]